MLQRVGMCILDLIGTRACHLAIEPAGRLLETYRSFFGLATVLDEGIEGGCRLVGFCGVVSTILQ